MRKWTSLFAAALLSVVVLAACGNNAAQQETTIPQTDAESRTTAETDGSTQAEEQTTLERNEEGSKEQASAAAEETDEGLAAEETDESSAADQAAETGPAKKVLVVYFSATGNTGNIANIIAEYTDADRFELIPVNEYSDEDLDWTAEGSRVNREHDDESLQDIELVSTTVEDFDTYDTIFIGYPIWWRNASWVVNHFVTDNDFTGKTVIPFCTSSSSDFGESGANLAKLAGTGDWLEGRRFSGSAGEEQVIEWLDSLDF